jgi:hypothetical protein
MAVEISGAKPVAEFRVESKQRGSSGGGATNRRREKMSLYKKLMGMAGLVVLASPLVMAQQATPATPATPASAATPVRRRPMNIEARQRRQQRRIAQGVRSGQLTAGETARLERREAGIERREQRMRASGGKFTPGERRAVQRQLNSTNRQIYRAKHNKRTQ